MILVFDTSTLQAVHRSGLSKHLINIADMVYVPRAVSIETAVAYKALGPEKVPYIPGKESGVHAVRDISQADAAALVTPLDHLPRRERHAAQAALARGRLLCHGRVLDQGEFEVIALARYLGGVAVIDDKKAIRCAKLAGVPYLTDSGIIAELATVAGVPFDEIKKRLAALDYHLSSR